jgi:hypothetical protein
MKYLKRFKINESKLPNGLLSLQDIENYFSDFIDDDWEMVESNAEFSRYVKIEGDDINNMKKSDIPKRDYDYFNRIIVLKFKITTIVDNIELLNIISNSYTMFSNNLSHFISAENLKLDSFSHHIDNNYLKFKFDFLEPLIEEDVDKVEDDISDFYEYLKGYFRQKANAHTTRWLQNDVEIKIDNDKIILDCEKLTPKQMDSLRSHIDDGFHDKKDNANYNKRRLDRGQINADTPGFLGGIFNFSYFDYKYKKSDGKIVYSDIKKINLT